MRDIGQDLKRKEKDSFLHTLFLENEAETSGKKYRAMFIN